MVSTPRALGRQGGASIRAGLTHVLARESTFPSQVPPRTGQCAHTAGHAAEGKGAGGRAEGEPGLGHSLSGRVHSLTHSLVPQRSAGQAPALTDDASVPFSRPLSLSQKLHLHSNLSDLRVPQSSLSAASSHSLHNVRLSPRRQALMGAVWERPALPLSSGPGPGDGLAGAQCFSGLQ